MKYLGYLATAILLLTLTACTDDKALKKKVTDPIKKAKRVERMLQQGQQRQADQIKRATGQR